MTNKHAFTNSLIQSINTLQNNAGEINRRKAGIYRNEGLPINARVNGLINAAKFEPFILIKTLIINACWDLLNIYENIINALLI
ncbi:hypothetical protein ArsFIN_55560 (plasmid) [Arsenophonus nasoniae]|uniref:Uncharacterized protein n=1 Tax=Arsenophonus nasoniae TaxID=638 RepID=A0A4P7L2L9_9GAMM|nr:hypothetical protein ArsFIN_55560 [Arsenophonus nasoniae]